MDFSVYILLCSDGSFYTGITNNLDERINQHNNGKNNGYTSSRLPVELVYAEKFMSASEAILREKQIKKWSRKKKQALINENAEELIKYAKKKF